MERERRLKTSLLEPGSDKGTIVHPFPMNYFMKPWELGQWFYQVVKIGIVQYVCFLTPLWFIFFWSAVVSIVHVSYLIGPSLSIFGR